MAINRFTGATNSNWGTATNWSLGTVPTASDGHDTTFDATSPNCTVNASARVCNRLTFAGYTNTITMTNQITVSGNLTFGAGMNVAGTGQIVMGATATITTNGYTWANRFTFAGTSAIYTLADNFNLSGEMISSGSLPTINGNNIYLSGNLSPATNMGSGTTNIILNGTCTWNGAFNIQNNLTINTAGTITLGANTRFITKTFTYTAGTVITTGNTMTCNGTNAGTWNCAGITWNNFTIGSSNSTITLAANMYISGTLSTGTSTDTVFSGAYRIYISGSMSNSSSAASYTTSGGFLGFEFTGTGTINCQGTFRPNININTSGIITFQSGVTFTYNTGTFTYTTGTVVTTGSVFQVNATATLNTDGIIWNTVNFTGTATITLSSNLTCNRFQLTGTTQTTTINGSNIYVNENLSHPNLTTGNISGTTVVNLVGNGTITMNATATGSNRLNIIVNTSGTYAMTGTVRHFLGSLTYTAGTLDMSAATYVFQGTLTVNQPNLVINILTLASAGSTINGLYGFEINTLSFNLGGVTHTFKSGNTYIITDDFNVNYSGVTNASPVTITSDSLGNDTFIILENNGTSTQDIAFVNATDIDSSGGLTIYTFKGTLSNTLNWNNLTPSLYQSVAIYN